MKTLFIIISFYLSIFIQLKVNGQGINQNVSCWLNLQYIECLNKNLPCECQKTTEGYYSIIIDTAKYSSFKYQIAVLENKQMEQHFYSLVNTAKDRYDIFTKKDTCNKLGSLFLYGDTAIIDKNGKKSKFVRSTFCHEFSITSFYEENVILLNESLIKRGYKTLDELLMQDSLRCACNKWLNNINLISVANGPNSWILRKANDTLIISKIVNINRDLGEPIIEEKMYEFKW